MNTTYCWRTALALCAVSLAGLWIAPVPLRSQDVHRGEQRYPESNIGDRYDTGDLKGNVPADRLLTLEDLGLLLRLSQHLIDKQSPHRRSRSAKDLGFLGHNLGMPALLAVFRDESENRSLRGDCLMALSRIRNRRVVDFLINEGLGDDPLFDHHAIIGLLELVGDKPPELHDASYFGGVRLPPEDPAERKEYLDIWRRWWQENQEKIELRRDRFVPS